MTAADRTALLAPYGILDTPPEPGFDDAVLLARDLCAAPVALVSLVTDDRQWFKARVNFPDCQTDLDRSICRYVVAENDLIVIPDLTVDPRTVANPLVTDAPHVRFYAGAPLIGTDGAVLGALCVLDTVPRPQGLSADQTRQLRALAGTVSEQLKLRRYLSDFDTAVTAHATAEAHRHASDRRWQELFETMGEGFIVGSLMRDDDGRVVDWRYDEVNRAWGELVGIDHCQARGRTLRELFPGVEQSWVDEPGTAIAENRSIRFTRQVGALDRWYDGFVQPTGGDGFLIRFVEVTERIENQRRLNAMMEVADRIRESGSIGEMTSATAAIVGRVLHASRAGYGHVDADTREVTIEPDWTAPGEVSIAGRHRFEDFGRIRDELARAEPLVIEDVDTDPRTAPDPGPMRALNIRALVNMPVREAGRTVAVFIVQSPTPRAWSESELSFIRNIADRLETGIARLRAEAQQAVVNGEIAHRLKNMLAMVQAIASQTLRPVGDRAPIEQFERRLLALSGAHDVLTQANWTNAGLREVVCGVLETFACEQQVRVEGPTVELGSRAAMSLALLTHELMTNAVKYGALSVPGGTVSITWQCEESGDESGTDEGRLMLAWREAGGPPVAPPTRRGFGSKLIQLGLVGTGGVSLRYPPSGVEADMSAALRELAYS